MAERSGGKLLQADTQSQAGPSESSKSRENLPNERDLHQEQRSCTRTVIPGGEDGQTQWRGEHRLERKGTRSQCEGG